MSTLRKITRRSGITFETGTEQIFYNVPTSDITKTTVTLSWPAGTAVTRIDVQKSGEVVQTHTLTADEIANGKATIEDLNVESTYTFYIYNGEKQRGKIQVATLPNYTPVKTALELLEAIEAAEAGEVIMLTENMVYDFTDAAALGKEDQDWSTDSAYNRSFGVKDDISVDQYDTYADIVFHSRANGTYTVELATDTLNDEIAEGTATGSKSYKFESSINKEVTVNIKNLIGNTRYFLRIRCVSDGSTPSNWLYYKDSKGYRSFKTKAEQIFNTVPSTDIQEDGVRLTWDASKEVTAISVYKGDERKDTVLLDNAALTAGEYTFSKTFGESGESIKSFNAPNLVQATATETSKIFDNAGTAYDPQYADYSKFDFTVGSDDIKALKIGDPRWIK